MNANQWMRCGVIVVLMSMWSCSRRETDVERAEIREPNTPNATSSSQPALLSLMTYNLGLVRGSVGFVEERFPKQISALKRHTADVLCLQEVWTDADSDRLRDELHETYPYSFRYRTVDASESMTPCGIWPVVTLDRCVKKSCRSKGIPATSCVVGECESEYRALSQECQRCLAANTVAPWRCAVFGAKSYLLEGRNGLLLLSRQPIANARYRSFDTALVKRGVIEADIDDTHVQCTHLSADLSVVPYPRHASFQNWSDEHRAQFAKLGESAPSDRCTIVLGDLNSGPDEKQLKGAWATNFSELERLGYRSLWRAPQCTWCRQNLLTGAEHDTQIDHILFKSCAYTTYRYRRMFDEPVDITTSEGVSKKVPLSDHYGVLVEVDVHNDGVK